MKDEGELDRVLIRNHHPAKISSKPFEVVQHAKFERFNDNTKEPEVPLSNSYHEIV